MSAGLIHRGPDEEGVHRGPGIALAMRRLSIIDLATGHQPVADERGRRHLVFNGEIYNHRELRAQLQAAGHRFASRSDTEVIVHALEDEGPDALQRLRGMFAIAMWDAQRSELFLAIDRVGIKPLYYTSSTSSIAFASELSALRASGLVRGRVDHRALAEYFEVGYIAAPSTAFEDVQKLSPGTLLRWSAGREPVLERYWQLPPTGRHHRGRTASEGRLREQLRDAVGSHLVSDVPVGAFLSGGVDSSSVVALMREAGASRVSTFSVGFSPRERSELPAAAAVAERFGTDHHELVVEPEAAAVLPALAHHYGEPFGDSSALMTYYVSKLAREHVKVVLSGDGGDELFLGYPLYGAVELAKRVEWTPEPVRETALRFVRSDFSSHLPERARRRLEDVLQGWRSAYRSKLRRPGLAAVAAYLTPTFRREFARTDPLATCARILAEEEATAASGLDAVARTSFRYSLPGDMLAKVDRASMANSLEVRVPLLDHVLVETVAALPVRERLPRWQLKGLFKATMADVLPPEVTRGPKRGFQAPLSSWLESLRSLAKEVLLSPACARRELLDVPAIASKLTGTSSARTPREADILWSLVMFELWCADAGI